MFKKITDFINIFKKSASTNNLPHFFGQRYEYFTLGRPIGLFVDYIPPNPRLSLLVQDLCEVSFLNKQLFRSSQCNIIMTSASE